MSKKEMKLCENCKNMVIQKGNAICKVSPIDCANTRFRGTMCGYEAEWFSPKED